MNQTTTIRITMQTHKDIKSVVKETGMTQMNVVAMLCREHKSKNKKKKAVKS